MAQLWLSGIISYFIGSFFVIKDRPVGHILDFSKGYLTMWLAGMYLPSGVSYLLASGGVLIGHTRPLFYKFNGDTTEALALGVITFMSPPFGLIILFFFLLLKFLFNDYDSAVFATSFLIPVLALKFFRSDSYIIISLLIFGSLAVQFWPPAFEKRLKPAIFTRAAFASLLLFLLLLFYFNKYVYKGFGVQRDIIRHGPWQFKYVAITFDDGPDPVYTLQILDILKEKGVPATFFLIGKNAEQYPEIARRIVKEGHSIGNHTYSHRSLIPLSARATREEIKKAEEAIKKATGVRATLFRPPRGVYSAYARKFLKEERYTMVLWDVSAMDWAELPPNNIVSYVVNRVKPGSIILFHDSGDLVTFKGGDRTSTVMALPVVIDELRARGYEFVTVDQMIFLAELMRTEEQVDENNSGGDQTH
ncbi:glycerol-3-phosphate acyltransferase [Thermosediminibacter litoriperuensis]|uniref:Peptidoglycan/xylan/chitin deacetylase (PgdA/CDA1 family) n=1 Tax=Thermosediminibacter litoriperuensis TaxID=291989 RepID=A0A5S5AN63_9FIRM|nr:glycerol-3-phosphate acyltransferase [Thermosediminibacter litoriperuensis]TYP52509.1 peptidoglycan/xylan/chitin deacetylase (PgdA/CDA1 family) [Thermosediminibacter litoriperuensis]